MQNQVTVFRSLIVISLVLSLVGAVIELVFPGLLPESLAQAYDAYTESQTSFTGVMVVAGLAVILMVIAVISTVGLLVLQPWARPLALWSTALSFVITPFLGAVLNSGLSLMLIDVSLVLWGAAMAMTFYSDLKVRFDPRPR